MDLASGQNWCLLSDPSYPGKPFQQSKVVYALSISRLDSTRSIKGRMPNSLDMARDSSSRDIAFSRSPGSLR